MKLALTLFIKIGLWFPSLWFCRISFKYLMGSTCRMEDSGTTKEGFWISATASSMAMRSGSSSVGHLSGESSNLAATSMGSAELKKVAGSCVFS